jgi:hypothetical protein
MKKLIPTVLVTLAAAVFSTQSLATANHNGHGAHDATHAPTAAKAPMVDGLVKKGDKPAGEATPSQRIKPSSKTNAHYSGPAASDGHAHEHTGTK